MGSRLVFVNNVRRSLRHKALWVIAFLAPLVLSFGVSLGNQFKSNSYRIGVFQSSEGERVEGINDILALLNQMDGVTAVAASNETIHTNLIMGTYHFGIDLTKISQGLTNHKELLESIVSYGDSEGKIDFIKFLEKNIHTADAEVNQNVNSPQLKKDDVKESASLSVMERIIAFIISLYMIMSVFHTSMYIRDKREGMVTRYCFSPKGKYSYMVGNYFYIFAITLIQTSISFIIICLLLHQSITLYSFLLMVTMLSMIASSFAIIISTLSKSDVQASILASAFTAVMSLISGTFISFSQLPAILQTMSMISPVRWCMELSKIIL